MEEVDDRVLAEWKLLEKRVGKRNLIQLVKGKIAQVTLGTTDPDFDQSWLLPGVQTQQLPGLNLRIDLSGGYPHSSPKILVLRDNVQASLAVHVQTDIDRWIDAAFSKSNGKPLFLLRDLVKFVDRSIGAWRPPPTSTGVEKELQEKNPIETDESVIKWTLKDQTAFENALRKFPSTMEKHARWRKIPRLVPNKTKKDCILRYKYLNREILALREAVKESHSLGSETSLTRQDEENNSLDEQTQRESVQEKSAQTCSSAKIWSVAQQEALDQALEEYPISMDKNERWKCISRRVSGKSLRECVDRFKFLRQEFLKKQTLTKSTEIGDEEEEEEEEEGGEEEEEEQQQQEQEEEEEEEEVTQTLPNLDPVERGVRGTLTKLDLYQVGFCFSPKLSLQVSCQACEKDLILDVNNEEPVKAWCKNCPKLLEICYHASLIHSESLGKLGYLDTCNIIIQDLIECDITCSCFQCGTMTTLAGARRDKTSQVACRGCFSKMSAHFHGWLIEAIGQPEKIQGPRTPPKKHYKDPRITKGKPLPNFGTCQHYKRSNRWYRFPCCGVAYPCDVCHEIEATSCSPGSWASKQICGFCAKEQLYSAENPCSNCGKLMGPSKSARHWEGGKGQRDKTKMSRKDAKKFSNSKMKTVSNKSHRVGPKKR